MDILRSNCDSYKTYFKKINRNNLNCVLCFKHEDQVHTFTQCQPSVLPNGTDKKIHVKEISPI